MGWRSQIFRTQPTAKLTCSALNPGEELRPWGRSFSATMQGRLWRRIDMASLDLAVNGEACALARGQG